MPRNDFDEQWRRLSDGTMELVTSDLRVVSDEEIENETARKQLLNAAIRARDIGLTNNERDRMLVLIARILLKGL